MAHATKAHLEVKCTHMYIYVYMYIGMHICMYACFSQCKIFATTFTSRRRRCCYCYCHCYCCLWRCLSSKWLSRACNTTTIAIMQEFRQKARTPPHPTNNHTFSHLSMHASMYVCMYVMCCLLLLNSLTVCVGKASNEEQPKDGRRNEKFTHSKLAKKFSRWFQLSTKRATVRQRKQREAENISSERTQQTVGLLDVDVKRREEKRKEIVRLACALNGVLDCASYKKRLSVIDVISSIKNIFKVRKILK